MTSTCNGLSSPGMRSRVSREILLSPFQSDLTLARVLQLHDNGHWPVLYSSTCRNQNLPEMLKINHTCILLESDTGDNLHAQAIRAHPAVPLQTNHPDVHQCFLLL
eukprot:scpid54296/ scgid16608/ 